MTGVTDQPSLSSFHDGQERDGVSASNIMDRPAVSHRLLALRGGAGGGSAMVNASGRKPRATAAQVSGAATGKQATDLAGRVTVIDAKPPACLAAG